MGLNSEKSYNLCLTDVEDQIDDIQDENRRTLHDNDEETDANTRTALFSLVLSILTTLLLALMKFFGGGEAGGPNIIRLKPLPLFTVFDYFQLNMVIDFVYYYKIALVILFFPFSFFSSVTFSSKTS